MTAINKNNTSVSFKGTKLTLLGKSLQEGSSMPAFTLTAPDMSDLQSSKYKGKVLILSVIPSLDTPVCAVQTKRFNTQAESLSKDVCILTVSLDLPFAQKRWCGTEGVTRVETASDFKYRTFGETFGCYIKEWGLLSRAVILVDQSGKVTHVEYVPDISQEPNYDELLRKVASLVESRP